MTLDFSGKVAVVTGGASGIGKAAAELLASAGASVHVFDLKGEPGVDVSNVESLEAAFSRVPAPDVVIVNAGTAPMAPMNETTEEQWRRTIDVNLTGAFNTVRIAASLMKPRRRGAIVLTASTNSYDGEADLIAYNASKAGVLGILHTAAGELGPFGVRINAVCPGLIRTPLTEGHFGNPAILKEYFRHVPMGRGGEAGEVANAIAFLACDQASYITGATLLVDGGQMAAKFGTWSDGTAEFDRDRWVLR